MGAKKRFKIAGHGLNYNLVRFWTLVPEWEQLNKNESAGWDKN